MGRAPRRVSSPGMRSAIVRVTRLARASTTVMESLCPLETNTESPPTVTPEGLLPPAESLPNGKPVRMNASRRGEAGFATSTTASEFDSGTLGSPNPGTSTGPRAVSTRAPDLDCSEGNPNAGNGRPLSSDRFASAPGTARYSNIPMLVT